MGEIAAAYRTGQREVGMDEAVEPRKARGWVLGELAREDLELYGREELEERIDALKAEIGRVEAQLARKKSSAAAADALFNFKDG
jgi:uncharacterized small protein (DUF1192 family)